MDKACMVIDVSINDMVHTQGYFLILNIKCVGAKKKKNSERGTFPIMNTVVFLP